MDDLIKHKKELLKNSKFREEYDALNRCKRCGIAGGKYTEKDTGKHVGVYLLHDARGYMMCNICASKGFLMKKEKLTKKDKRQVQHMRKEMNRVAGIPHVTLDRKGKVV